jgi:hypothetical protein
VSSTCIGGGSVCGDGACNIGEDCSNCPSDCGLCETCPPTLFDCAGTCVDPSSDPQNCGGCGIACSPGQVCEQGACVDSRGSCGNGRCDPEDVLGGCPEECGSVFCPPGLTECAGTCIDLSSDPQNCGGCATACEVSEMCVSGVCVGSSVCGDGACNIGEDCSNCPSDCGLCVSCGDGVCDSPIEDPFNCPFDCGGVGPVCGDGFCA